jgi:hypothetical protein
MRYAAGVDVAVGRCYVCRRPVHRAEATRINDPAVIGPNGRPVRRLAHYGACAEELRLRMAGPPIRGFEP